MLADGLLVYRGRLRRSSAKAEAEWQSVVLSDEHSLCAAEHGAGRIFFSGDDGFPLPLDDYDHHHPLASMRTLLEMYP